MRIYPKGSKSPQSLFEGFFVLPEFHGCAGVDGASMEFIIDGGAGASGVVGKIFGAAGGSDIL